MDLSEKQTETVFGPPKLTFTTLILKIFSALTGGILGSLILILIFVFASSFLSSSISDSSKITPIFIFFMMVMIFIASTTGNLLTVFLTALTERDKYTRISSAILQSFFINVIIFILIVPVYFIAYSINISIIVYIVWLHFILSAQASALILEIISNNRYVLLKVYGITFAILISSAVLLGLAALLSNKQILLFLAMPVIWGTVALISGIVEMIYGGIVRIYDKDFLK